MAPSIESGAPRSLELPRCYLVDGNRRNRSERQNAGPVTRWTKAFWEAVHPFALAGAYPNFIMDDEGDARLQATYGSNYVRLLAVKTKCDSANVFRINHNIKPAA